MQYGREEFRIRPAADNFENEAGYFRSHYSGYHGKAEAEEHDEELIRRMERLHEIYEVPIYNDNKEFGHISITGKFYMFYNQQSFFSEILLQ